MLAPKKVKFRKQHRGRMKGMAKGGYLVSFGDYGLIALEPAWITSRQIEACFLFTPTLKPIGFIF